MTGIEAILFGAGATDVRIDLGPNVYLSYRRMQTEEPAGWAFVDNRRRYPHEVAANLTFKDAVRFASQFTSDPRGGK